jgi:hypothetical protein
MLSKEDLIHYHDVDLWASGFVNRWHTFPDPRLRNAGDTTAAHSWRVAMLVFRLFQFVRMDDKAMLQNIMVALLHDTHEVVTGDIPYSAKRASPALRAEEERVGARWLEERGVLPFDMTPEVKLCDRLDSYLLAAVNAPDILDQDAWVDMANSIISDADDLGVGREVAAIMREAQYREMF